MRREREVEGKKACWQSLMMQEKEDFGEDSISAKTAALTCRLSDRTGESRDLST